MTDRDSTVLICQVKNEKCTLRSGYKQLSRQLKASHCNVLRIDAANGLTANTLAQASIVIFGSPTQPFTAEEFDLIRKYVNNGGNVMVLASEGGECKAGTNMNYLLEEFGLSFNNDCVIQSAYRK